MPSEFAGFVPHGPLPFVVWRADDVEVDVPDFLREYGFGNGSAQHNFFVSPPAGAVVVLLHTSSRDPPRHLADPAVVARAFGTVSARGTGELWHVGVRKSHPLGSARGRWGVRGGSAGTRTARPHHMAARGGKGDAAGPPNVPCGARPIRTPWSAS